MVADDEWGTRFWNILTNFTPEEKSRYLRCVGGRTRLPPAPRLTELRHKVYLRDESYHNDHDEHDCSMHPESFNIYLNRFSSEELMRTKILEAIEHSERYYIHGKGDKDSDQLHDSASIGESGDPRNRAESQLSYEEESGSVESEGDESEEDESEDDQLSELESSSD